MLLSPLDAALGLYIDSVRRPSVGRVSTPGAYGDSRSAPCLWLFLAGTMFCVRRRHSDTSWWSYATEGLWVSRI